jgi:hypothetical protein
LKTVGHFTEMSNGNQIPLAKDLKENFIEIMKTVE